MDECKCTRNVEIALKKKKRKLGCEDSELSSSSYDSEIESDSSEKFGFVHDFEESDGDFTSSDRISASDCSSYDSGNENCVRSVHLEVKRFETEISSSSSDNNNNNKISNDRTPQQSEISSNTSSMESSPAKTKTHRKQSPTTVKMPSAEELDAFFSAAEKYEQKKFAEKYNYDVVNDVPMEGRYEWIQLKP